MRAATELAFEIHAAVHELDQLTADRKPQARAAELARDAAVGLLERLEDALLFIRRYTDAGVRHGELERRLLAGVLNDCDGQQYRAGLGELDRVVDEIAEYLPQTDRIAVNHGRYVAGDVCGDFDVLVVGARAEQSDDLFEFAPQLERRVRQCKLASLGLGQIEHIVDEGDQRFGGTLERAHEAALPGVEGGVLEQGGHADNAIERRAQFVAHVGEEARFRLHGRLGGKPRAAEHRGVALLFGDVGDHGGHPGDIAVFGDERGLGDDHVVVGAVAAMHDGFITLRCACRENLFVGLAMIVG